jgi:hypothetical protein
MVLVVAETPTRVILPRNGRWVKTNLQRKCEVPTNWYEKSTPSPPNAFVLGGKAGDARGFECVSVVSQV